MECLQKSRNVYEYWIRKVLLEFCCSKQAITHSLLLVIFAWTKEQKVTAACGGWWWNEAFWPWQPPPLLQVLRRLLRPAAAAALPTSGFKDPLITSRWTGRTHLQRSSNVGGLKDGMKREGGTFRNLPYFTKQESSKTEWIHNILYTAITSEGSDHAEVWKWQELAGIPLFSCDGIDRDAVVLKMWMIWCEKPH